MFSCPTGVANLASPHDQENFLESPLQDQTSNFWSVDPRWDQTGLGDLFFDQVAELEKLTSVESCKGIVLGKSWDANGAQNMEDVVGLVELSPNVRGCNFSVHGPEENTVLEMFEQQTLEHSTSLPSGETLMFDQSQGSPSSVGSSCSDEALEKRIRNNKASRKFRRVRKERHKTLFARASKLERENSCLKLQVNQMMREIISLRSLLPKSIVHA